LTRPWCIGEITTAYLNGVTLVPLALPDCPSWAVVGADFWEEIEEALRSGTTCITQYAGGMGGRRGGGVERVLNFLDLLPPSLPSLQRTA